VLKLLRKLLRIKNFAPDPYLRHRHSRRKTVQEELAAISKRLDDAYAKYEKNPNLHNTLYLDGLLDITENLVSNLEKLAK